MTCAKCGKLLEGSYAVLWDSPSAYFVCLPCAEEHYEVVK